MVRCISLVLCLLSICVSQVGAEEVSSPSVEELLAQLKKQNSGGLRLEDPWMRTMKKIIEIGPDAIPALIKTLDENEDEWTLRCMGFMLRAIDDPRAIPALIRSIPKTLIKPSSDYGARLDDAELMKFAQQHDLDKHNRDNLYSFGRPSREIFGALHQLTDQNFGEGELNFVFLQGLPAQLHAKKLAYHQVATRWAKWWESNADEFVEDQSYHVVNLPAVPEIDALVMLPPNQRYRTEGGSSNSILESVLADAPERCFYDIETGRIAPLPEHWQKLSEEERTKQLPAISKWAREQGFDFMGTQTRSNNGKSIHVIQSIGMQVWELHASYWKRSLEDVSLEELQEAGHKVQDKLLSHMDREQDFRDESAPATFLCITAQKTPMIFYLGVPVEKTADLTGQLAQEDSELQAVGYTPGRRFGFALFEEMP